MKARVALILIVVAVAVIVFVIVRYPGAKGREVAAPTAPTPITKQASSPRESVTWYLEALYRNDYEAAYGRLSAGSKEAHPYEDFVRQAASGEATVLELSQAKEGPERNGRVLVSVPISEDPAEASFTTVKEDEDWKVVFIGGAPWFPYDDEQGKDGAAGEG